MKTNESILSQQIISYNDIELLKNRSNKNGEDVINYDSFEPMQIDKVSGRKGLDWLKSLLNTKGEPRKDTRLDYREIDIIQHATNEDFEFVGFYDDNRGYGYHNFKPIYRVGSMEYIPYANGQKIYIVG